MGKKNTESKRGNSYSLSTIDCLPLDSFNDDNHEYQLSPSDNQNEIINWWNQENYSRNQDITAMLNKSGICEKTKPEVKSQNLNPKIKSKKDYKVLELEMTEVNYKIKT